ncbi:MAG: NAD-dependent epimerase/dehydratase family protein [Bacillaceae bacterium]
MKKVLVFGGTRFFGKRLVMKLIEKGYEVTIATRGKSKDEFGDAVNRIVLDRAIKDESFDALKKETWDIVYDNICYSSNEMMIAMKTLKGRVKKYVLTSTLSVYEEGNSPIVERNFNPLDVEIKKGGRTDFSYKEGKQMAEAVLFQQNLFPAVAVRFPIVLGEDDYTRRLHWHIERTKNNAAIYFPNKEAKMSFITSEEAADVLLFIGENDIVGPVNATSTDAIGMNELINLIEKVTNKKANVVMDIQDETDHSPFGVEDDWYMSNALLQSKGFCFSKLEQWLPQLVKNLAN